MSTSELFDDDMELDAPAFVPQKPQTSPPVAPSSTASFAPIDFEALLNPDQFAAVTAPPGPALVLAGAGSGKTRTLTYRVAWLLSQGVAPEEILLLTFTNKAAKEMLGRVQDLTGIPGYKFWGGTFHHIGQRTLRMSGEHIGIGKNYSILDEGESESLLSEVVREIDSDFFKNKENPKAKVLSSIISYARNTQLPLQDAINQNYPQHADHIDQITGFAKKYAEKKLAQQVTDYDDLLELWLHLLRVSEPVAQWFTNRFKHVLVDEYQDTNALQSAIVDKVAAHHQVMAVGDDAQCIYTWRGANFENIMTFPDRHPGTKVYKILLNYRSTPEILDLANRVLEDRPDEEGYHKDLQAVRSSLSLPTVVPAYDPKQQAQYICRKIVELHREEGHDLSSICVLYRAHFQAMDLQMELSRHSIPFQITSGVRFFAQAHVKDLTSQIMFLANTANTMAFQRFACLLPKLGPRAAEKIYKQAAQTAQKEETDIVQVLGHPDVLVKVPKDAKDYWPEVALTLKEVKKAMDIGTPTKVIEIALEGWYLDYIREIYDNWTTRADDLESLIGFAARYTDLNEMLSQLVLLNAETTDRSIDPAEDAVRLSTIHQAKGLEYPVVFVIGLADGAFPLQRAIDNDDVEEERRLFYVAVTRAQDELWLTYPTTSFIRGGAVRTRPSMFLRSIPEDHYVTERIAGSAPSQGYGYRGGYSRY
jgi:DNA helicase-2/ATP-dependent DNA helicase PcrA